MARAKIIIVTGLSGSGLSTAIHTLQDNGFYCIDNLPIELLWDTIGLIEAGEISSNAGYAFGMDIRNSRFAQQFPKIKKELAERVDLDVLFLTSSKELLEERFATARRRHPLSSKVADLENQISFEVELLHPVEKSADVIIDTTHLLPKQLRQIVENRCGNNGRPLRTLQIVLISFGFKYSSIWPIENLHDVRFLQNPYFEPDLKDRTGLETDVKNYVFNSLESQIFLEKIIEYYQYVVPKYLDEGRHFLRVGIGCTGGRHRSVAFVERLSIELQSMASLGLVISVVHRDIER